MNTKYEKYKVVSIIKPHAPTHEILKSCNEVEDTPGNYIILGVGQDDANPAHLAIELATTLNKFQYTNIIILNVTHNPYLNEWKLNNQFKQICNNIKHCRFLFISQKTYKKNVYSNIATKKINLLIHSDYTDKYLPNIKNSIKTNGFCKTGTIPYYFSIIKKNFEDSNLRDPNITNIQIKWTIVHFFANTNKGYTETSRSLYKSKYHVNKRNNDYITLFHQNIAGLLNKLIIR
ncbi:hypothetical protein O3G_MSEX009856 [Manduca sexta]|uniref:Uncharacterized protein n=1 Tax=Manduca sexta TaxID=7130 RepID=A0A921ZF50_MANSE|nr:hypothetical protein O3G_MSEX009856 [Manduca sexta]